MLSPSVLNVWRALLSLPWFTQGELLAESVVWQASCFYRGLVLRVLWWKKVMASSWGSWAPWVDGLAAVRSVLHYDSSNLKTAAHTGCSEFCNTIKSKSSCLNLKLEVFYIKCYFSSLSQKLGRSGHMLVTIGWWLLGFGSSRPVWAWLLRLPTLCGQLLFPTHNPTYLTLRDTCY